MLEQARKTALKMQRDWDERARENARYYVATTKTEWTDEEFYATGEAVVQEQILNDLENYARAGTAVW
jgi:hypothetical protein